MVDLSSAHACYVQTCVCEKFTDRFLIDVLNLLYKGRDNKGWAGHFGSLASAAMVRVKSDAKPAENDGNSDVVEDTVSAEKIHQLTRLIGKLNDDYSEGLREMEDNEGKVYIR